MQIFNRFTALSFPIITSTTILLFSPILAHAASDDCNTLNTSNYTANANGSFTVDSNQFFELDAGEIINFSANVPAGAEVVVIFAGVVVRLDNTAGTAPQLLQGQIIVPNTGANTIDSIRVIAGGLSVGDSVTVNFDCDSAALPPSTGITGDQIGATADDLVSAVYEPIPAPNGFAGLLTAERIARAQEELDNKQEDQGDRLERIGAEIRKRSKIQCAGLHAQIAASRAREDALGAIVDRLIEQAENDNPGIGIPALFEIPSIKNASAKSDGQNIKVTVPLVNKLGACEDKIDAQVSAEFRLSRYAPDTPQTTNKRFDAVLNQGRISGTEINSILEANGFSSKFYTGDLNAPQPWVVFLNTSGTLGGDNRKGADRTTQAWNVALGAQKRVNANTTLGISGNYKRAVAKSKATDSELEADYFSVAFSANRQLSANAALAFSASYTHGLNDISIGNSVGSFAIDAFSANASLSNSTDLREATLATSLSASLSQISREAYTDSNALFVPGSKNTSASFGANATVSRTYKDIGNFSSITPSLGISGSYNFREKLVANLVNGVEANQLGLGATLNTGFNATFQNGVSANLSSSYGLYQDNVQNWSVTGALIFPLH